MEIIVYICVFQYATPKLTERAICKKTERLFVLIDFWLNLFLRCWTEINHYPVKEQILVSSSIVIDNKPLYSCVDVFSFGIGESFFKIA
jgi:hypothetical protein